MMIRNFEEKKRYICLINLIYRTLGDRVGEAKASGNLGNTLKVLGKFDEAIVCCLRHLDLSRELKDRVYYIHNMFILYQSRAILKKFTCLR